MNHPLKKIHLIISGRVQGVFFRASTQKMARNLNLTGWVKNLPSGDVEVVAEGEEKNLKKLAAWCVIGPEAASVTNVQESWGEATEEFSEFRII